MGRSASTYLIFMWLSRSQCYVLSRLHTANQVVQCCWCVRLSLTRTPNHVMNMSAALNLNGVMYLSAGSWLRIRASWTHTHAWVPAFPRHISAATRRNAMFGNAGTHACVCVQDARIRSQDPALKYMTPFKFNAALIFMTWFGVRVRESRTHQQHWTTWFAVCKRDNR